MVTFLGIKTGLFSWYIPAATLILLPATAILEAPPTVLFAVPGDSPSFESSPFSVTNMTLVISEPFGSQIVLPEAFAARTEPAAPTVLLLSKN